jgi:hypothetical protein
VEYYRAPGSGRGVFMDTEPRSALGSTLPLAQWALGSHIRRVKWSNSESKHYPQLNAEVRMHRAMVHSVV